ncbi:MAG: hypothetical protein ACPG6R_11835 [Aequoribacter sp.]|uniref:hypothetical protein n=1 Tax=Aequoribacter sp. TaxID=2847771 RepID=UPI003C6977D7
MRIAIALLLVAGFAHGQNETGITPGPSTSQSQQQTSTQTQSNSQDNAQEQSQTNGDSNSNNAVDIRYPRDKRNAPGLAFAPPQLLNECERYYGGGGSNSTGSIIGGFPVLQKDCWAVSRFTHLSGLGQYEAGAKAYCSRKMHVRDFKDRKDCQDRMAAGAKWKAQIHLQRFKLHVKQMEIDGAKACEGRYGEKVEVKEYLDTHGASILYDCIAREPGKNG